MEQTGVLSGSARTVEEQPPVGRKDPRPRHYWYGAPPHPQISHVKNKVDGLSIMLRIFWRTEQLENLRKMQILSRELQVHTER
jgi:hypothetical protein